MNPSSSRRDFLRHSLTLAALAAGWKAAGTRLSAIEPFRRPAPPRFSPSLVGYSFREYFNAKDAAKPFTLFDLIDYCAVQGFAGVELTGYYFPQPLPDDYLIRIKRHAHLRGVTISGTSVGNELGLPPGRALDAQIAAVKAWVDAAAVLGAPYVRVFASGHKKIGAPGAIPACIRAFDECSDYAGQRGIFLGLENDGGILPDTVLEIVRGVRSPWFGLNLDVGNYHTADVYGDLARCAPYAINVHFKSLIQEAGQPERPTDIPRVLKILADAGYEGWLAFEYGANGDPLTAIPPWLAATKTAITQGGYAA